MMIIIMMLIPTILTYDIVYGLPPTKLLFEQKVPTKL